MVCDRAGEMDDRHRLGYRCGQEAEKNEYLLTIWKTEYGLVDRQVKHFDVIVRDDEL